MSHRVFYRYKRKMTTDAKSESDNKSKISVCEAWFGKEEYEAICEMAQSSPCHTMRTHYNGLLKAENMGVIEIHLSKLRALQRSSSF